MASPPPLPVGLLSAGAVLLILTAMRKPKKKKAKKDSVANEWAGRTWYDPPSSCPKRLILSVDGPYGELWASDLPKGVPVIEIFTSHGTDEEVTLTVAALCEVMKAEPDLHVIVNHFWSNQSPDDDDRVIWGHALGPGRGSQVAKETGNGGYSKSHADTDRLIAQALYELFPEKSQGVGTVRRARRKRRVVRGRMAA